MAYTGQKPRDNLYNVFSQEDIGVQEAVQDAQIAADILAVQQSDVGFKNFIIGGDFTTNPWQRSVGASGTGYVAADRWLTNGGGTQAKSAVVPTNEGFFYSLKFTSPDTSAFRGIGQRIEATTAKALAGQTVTLSFWINLDAASLATSPYIAWRRPNTTDDDYTATVSIGTDMMTPTADTWTKISVTRTLPAEARYGIEIAIYINGAVAGTTGIGYIAGIQLEKGSVATEFEYRPYGLELSLCRRYTKDLNKIALRPYIVTANVIYFKIPSDLRTLSSGSVFGTEGTDWVISTLPGAAQTGFVLAVASAANGQILITATKTTHGITDGTLEFLTANTNVVNGDL